MPSDWLEQWGPWRHAPSQPNGGGSAVSRPGLGILYFPAASCFISISWDAQTSEGTSGISVSNEDFPKVNKDLNDPRDFWFL